MADTVHPKVDVFTAPQTVSKGQMISIHATITDRYTKQPIAFDRLYMEIIDGKGIPVWPLSTIEMNSWTISKLISTSDMKAGETYTVRVTPSKFKRPMGDAQFKIDGTVIPPAFLVPTALLIPAALLARPRDPVFKKVESVALEPAKVVTVKIAWLIYRTELDQHVCPICKPDEGKMFRPDDPNLPIIKRHFGCRCHYDIVTVDDERGVLEAALQVYEANEAIAVFNAWKAARFAGAKK